MKRVALVALATATATTMGCADRYAFRPTEQVSGTLAGYPASKYSIPPSAPTADVRITSLGITNVELERGAPKVRCLGVRMAVSNHGAVPFSFDAREQRLTLAAAGESRPAFARADGDRLPVVEIRPHEHRAIDLYYALPTNMSAKQIDQFAFIWRVDAPGRIVTDRTPFQRVLLQPVISRPYAPPSVTMALPVPWGSLWYYDPFYSASAYYHPVIIERYAKPLVEQPAPPPKEILIAEPRSPRRM